jgi:predicted choloylglycine hydrolase
LPGINDFSEEARCEQAMGALCKFFPEAITDNILVIDRRRNIHQVVLAVDRLPAGS